MSIKENASRVDTWIRGLFIVVFAIIFNVVWTVIGLLVLIQFITKVVSGNLNSDLVDFSKKLTDYATEILLFITFQQDQKPFPFTSTPDSLEKVSEETADDSSEEETKQLNDNGQNPK